MCNVGITAKLVVGLGPVLRATIQNALADVLASGPHYRRWFGTPGNHATVLHNMTLMNNFANSAATVTLINKTDGPHGNNFGYAWSQGNRSGIGQYIFNLGSRFGAQDGLVAHYNVTSWCMITLAHELSHLVFGANQNPPAPAAYSTEANERYGPAALNLTTADPNWAAWNAENYGYFIEHCS